jgi:hypothetical protein
MKPLEITQYQVGDKVWYHQGMILVLCTIEQVITSPNPNMPNLYRLDEPLGFDISGDQLESSFIRAKNYYLKRQMEYKDQCAHDGELVFLPNLDLDQDRAFAIQDILTNFLKRDPSPQEIQMQLWMYPPKNHRTEWFNFADLTDQLG